MCALVTLDNVVRLCAFQRRVFLPHVGIGHGSFPCVLFVLKDKHSVVLRTCPVLVVSKCVIIWSGRDRWTGRPWILSGCSLRFKRQTGRSFLDVPSSDFSICVIIWSGRDRWTGRERQDGSGQDSETRNSKIESPSPNLKIHTPHSTPHIPNPRPQTPQLKFHI